MLTCFKNSSLADCLCTIIEFSSYHTGHHKPAGERVKHSTMACIFSLVCMNVANNCLHSELYQLN